MFDVYLYNYGNRAAIISTKWIWFSAPVMGSVIAATVQLFFAWRIFALAKPSKLHRAALRKAMYTLVFVIVIVSELCIQGLRLSAQLLVSSYQSVRQFQGLLAAS